MFAFGAAVGFCVILGFMGAGAFMLFNGTGGPLGYAFLFVPTIAGVQLLLLLKKRSQNYAWYAQQHPDCVIGDSVKCRSCGSRKIHTRNLMNHSYTRVHFCSKCGTNLYYSPE